MPEQYSMILRNFIFRLARHPFIPAPLILYYFTAARHIGLADSVIITDAMSRPVISSQVCNHNLINVIGYIFQLLPAGDVILRASLVSVFCGGLAVVLFYCVLLKLGAGRLWASLIGAVFMVSHSMWWHSTVAESYALNLVFLNAALLLILADVASKEVLTPRRPPTPEAQLLRAGQDRHVARQLPGKWPLSAFSADVAKKTSFRSCLVFASLRRCVKIASFTAEYEAAASDVAAQFVRPRRYVVALAFLAGLSVFNHLQNGALAVAALAYIVASRYRCPERHAATWLVCATALICGALPWLAVLARDCLQSAAPAETLHWAIGGGFTKLMFDYKPATAARTLADWIFMQFPSPFLACIIIGVALSLRDKARRPFFVFLYTVLLVNTVFFAGYTTWDQFSFYLLSFAALAVLGGYAVIELARRFQGPTGRFTLALLLIASLLLPPLIYPNISRWSQRPGYWERRYGHLERAYRGRYDLVGFLANPNKRHADSLERFARLILERMPPQALFIDDSSIFYQLEFLRKQRGLRPDLEPILIQPLGIAGWGLPPDDVAHAVLTAGRPVFFVTARGPCGQILERIRGKNGTIEKFPLAGDLFIYRLVPDLEPRGPGRQPNSQPAGEDGA